VTEKGGKMMAIAHLAQGVRRHRTKTDKTKKKHNALWKTLKPIVFFKCWNSRFGNIPVRLLVLLFDANAWC
jgi:hypothetical protein